MIKSMPDDKVQFSYTNVQCGSKLFKILMNENDIEP